MIETQALHLLVVEDDDFQRALLVQMLSLTGISKISEARNGKEAIVRIEKNQDAPVDIILTDLNMPEMDGLEFLRRLSNIEHNFSLIIITGLGGKLLASAASMAKALNIKIIDVLEKPVALEDLKKCLARHNHIENNLNQAKETVQNFSLNSIQKGIQDGQFKAFYQPQVDIKTGKLVGAEALVRWIHPDHKTIPPISFIPILERDGEIDPLTFKMLEQGAIFCRDIRENNFDITISVNLSLASLDNEGFADKIFELISKIGLDPKHLVLEISETAAMSNVVLASENLARLCMHGFPLSIDDYGTGFSNIEQLVRIACSELKIDRSFVSGFTHDESLRTILETSIDMAHRLGLRVVAEGVETQQEYDALMKIKCDVAQGYFIEKALPENRFREFILNHSD